VGQLRRTLVTAATTLMVAAAGAAIAQPAHADTIFNLNYPHTTGSTFLAKPKVTAPIPTSTVMIAADLDTGTLTGTAQISDLTVHLNLAGLVGTTATVSIVPAGGLTGSFNLTTATITTTTRFTIAVRNVHLDATPGINLVPSGCRTRTPTSATLNNTTPLQVFGSTTVSGTYTVPGFTHCGLLTPLLTLLLSGPNNVLTLTIA
jgi:hypothetical protein